MPKKDLEICEVGTMSGMWMQHSIGCRAPQEREPRSLSLGVGVSTVPFGMPTLSKCSHSKEYRDSE